MPPSSPRPHPTDGIAPAAGRRRAVRWLLVLALAAWPARSGPAQDADSGNGRAVAAGAYSLDPEGACFRCHGPDGSGDVIAGFPRLAGQYRAYLHDTLRDYASGTRPDPIMGPIAEALTDEEMRDVAAHYALIGNAPPARPPEAQPGVLAEGEALALRGAPGQGVSPCANCHGAAGMGQPPFFPYLAGQGAVYLERQLLLWKRGVRGGDPGGIMGHIAERLSHGQIRAVARYYASLQPDDGAPVATGEERDANPPE